MPLSPEQRSMLSAEAKRRGIDEAKLIAAAESQLASDTKAGSDAGRKPPSSDKPAGDKPLYMYHLPFVTVNEVRTIWLGLEPLDGGDENAAKYAAAQVAGPAKPPADA